MAQYSILKTSLNYSVLILDLANLSSWLWLHCSNVFSSYLSFSGPIASLNSRALTS